MASKEGVGETLPRLDMFGYLELDAPSSSMQLAPLWEAMLKQFGELFSCSAEVEPGEGKPALGLPSRLPKLNNRSRP